MAKLSMSCCLVCVAGAFLLWPTATGALSSSVEALASNAPSFGARSSSFRSSVSVRALAAESGLGDYSSAERTFDRNFPVAPSLVEAGAAADTAADPLPDTPAVRKLKTAVSVAELNKFSTKRMLARLSSELQDPSKSADRKKVIDKLRERHQSTQRVNKEIRDLMQDAKKSVAGHGEVAAKAVTALAIKAMTLNNEQEAILEFQLPPK